VPVLATLGDAPTAAIAVVAILLGLLFAARGSRDKRGAQASGDGEERSPMMVSMPVPSASATPEPDVEPGFVGPEGTIVGHGPIRLGAGGPLGAGAGSAEAQPAAAAEPEPEPIAYEPAPVEPAPVEPPAVAGVPAPEPEPMAPEPALFTSPPTIPEPLAGAVALDPPATHPSAPDASPPPPPPPAEPEPAAEEPPAHREPAWRVAAQAANSAMHFRQGTIRVGGKPVDKRKDP
jgi:hypothetical protein